MFEYLVFILQGMKVLAIIFFSTAILSFPLGLLLSIAGISKNMFLRKFIEFYTWIFRGTPLMMQLFFVYYGLPVVGITFEPMTAAILTFVINYGAYLCEIFRGSILGVDQGQYEAAKVLGMSYNQTMRRIVIPQALRTAFPALGNEIIALTRDTSIISTIGMAEILRNTRELVTRDFTITPFIICGVIYLAISTIAVYCFKKVEKRLGV